MRIALIAAGAGPRFSCENCARDDALERALRDRGHDVAAASPASDRHQPLFYGAVNLYLRHRFPSLRSAPRWVERLLDAPPLLRAAGAMAGATNASGLTGLTLSNCLLLGIARRARRELGVPVLCTLQDEDTWIDSLGAEDRAVAWQVLRERAVDVDLFLPVSRWYARFMAERMAIPEARIAIVPVGIDVEAFAARPGGLPFDPPVIGYLSRVCERMGAGLLADAFVLLLEGARFPGLRLRYTGGSTAADASLIASIKRRIVRAGGRAEFVHAFGQEDRARFIASLTVLSVPVPGSEAFGTFLLEAGAAGVPVVQPRAGGFTELVDDTGGGLLCEPGSAESLARALSDLPSDRDQAHSLGRAGSDAVRARYSTASMAAGLEAAVERARRSR
ncbi:MAG: glycosyltransferase family 4 protein [Spirochaetes bacterium]|nr:glycosyltransferase family 4 protein [Spirochaetota bacterium]